MRLPIQVSRPRRRAQAPFVRRIGSRVRGKEKVPCGRLVSGRSVSRQGRGGDQATISAIVPIASSCWLLPGVLRLMSRSRRVPRQWPASSGPGWGGAGIGKIRLGIGRLGTDRWREIGESRMREFGGASRSIPHRSSDGGQVGDHCSGFKVTAKATGGAARSVVLVENGRSGSGVGPGHWIRMK